MSTRGRPDRQAAAKQPSSPAAQLFTPPTDLRPRRVHQAGQPQEDEALLEPLPQLRRPRRPRRHHRGRLGLRERARGEGQHPEALLREDLHLRTEQGHGVGVASVVEERVLAGGGADVRAEGEEGLEGALGQEAEGRGGAVAVAAAAGGAAAPAVAGGAGAAPAANAGHDHGHALDAAVEGELGDERGAPRAQQPLLGEARLGREHLVVCWEVMFDGLSE